MKKLLMLMIVGILLISSASALEFDNVKVYSDKDGISDKVVTITNAFGLGDKITEIEYMGDTQSPNRIIGGVDRTVLRWDVNLYENYTDFVHDLDLFNMRSGEFEDKSYHWEIGYFGTVKGNATTEDSYEIVKREDVESNDMLKGHFELYLVMDVTWGDYYDGIPTFAGEYLSAYALFIISDAVWELNNSLSAQDTSPQGFDIVDSGTKFFMTGDGSNKIHHYSMSDAENVSSDSLSFVRSLDVNLAVPGGLAAVAFCNATTMVASGYSGEDVKGFTLPDDYDITSTTNNVSFTVPGSERITGIRFWQGGLTMVVMGDRLNNLYQFNLSAVCDITTATLEGVLDISGSNANNNGLDLKEDGTQVYTVGSGNPDSIFDYTISTPFNITTGTETDNKTVFQDEPSANDVLINDEGSLMHVVGSSTGDNIHQYILGDSPIPPTINILDPANNTDFAQFQMSLNYSVDNGESCWASNDTGAINTSFVVAGINLTLGSIQGDNEWTVYCNSSFGLESFDVINFSVTLTSPTINVIEPGNTNHSHSDIDFNISVSDDVNVSICIVSMDNLATGNITLTAFNLTDFRFFNDSMPDNLDYLATFWCNDTDNQATTITRAFGVHTGRPILRIDFPSNESLHNSNLIDINWTLTEPLPDTCYWSNSSGLVNNTLASCGTNITGLTWDEGVNTIGIWANDSAGNVNSTSVQFTIDSIPPQLTITSPSSANFTDAQVVFNLTSNENMSACFLSFDAGVTNYTMILNASITAAGLVNSSVPDNTDYLVSFYCNDSFGNFNTTETIAFGIDTIVPVAQIDFPTDALNNTDGGYVVQAFTQIDFNWTASDSGGGLDTCVFNNGSVDKVITCGDGQLFINTTYFDFNNYSLIVNDTFGNTNTTRTFSKWLYVALENQESHSATTTEGNLETFTLNVSITEGLQVSTAKLFYNGTAFAGVIDNIGEDQFVFTKTMSIPSFSANVNTTFFWEIVLEDDTTANSTIFNQTVNILGLDNCSVNTILILNYTLRDEDTQAFLIPNINNTNTSIEVDIQVFPIDSTVAVINISTSYTNTNPAQVCVNINLTSTSNYRMNTLASYTSTGRVLEFHNIQNFSLTNDSIPNNINLFDLLNTNSQEFLITFKDENFLPVSGALIDITRRYISDGVFKSVEVPITDSDGQTIGHLVLSDNIYTFIVSRDGQVLGTFENIVAFCDNQATGDCKIPLNAFGATARADDFVTVSEGISFTFDFDEDNRRITVLFTTTQGLTKVVSLNTSKSDRFGNNTVCSDTLTSSSGTLICDIPLSFGNVSVISDLVVNGQIASTSSFTIAQEPSEIFGATGAFLLFVMVITLALMFITSTIGLVFGLIVGLIAGATLVIYNGGGIIGVGATLIWVVLAGIIIIFKIAGGGE